MKLNQKKKILLGILFFFLAFLVESFLITPQDINAQSCQGSARCCKRNTICRWSGPYPLDGEICTCGSINPNATCNVVIDDPCFFSTSIDCSAFGSSDCEGTIPNNGVCTDPARTIEGSCVWVAPAPAPTCAPGYSYCGSSTTCIQGCYYTNGGKSCNQWINELCAGSPTGTPPPSGCNSTWCTSSASCSAIPGSSQSSGSGYCSSASDVRCCVPPSVTPTCGGWSAGNPPNCAVDGEFGYEAANNWTCCSGLVMGYNGVCVCSFNNSIGCNVSINNLATFVPGSDPFTVGVTTTASDGLGINPRITISSDNPSIISLAPILNDQNVSAPSTINQTATKQTHVGTPVKITATVTSQGCTRPGDTLCNRRAICTTSATVYACSSDTPTPPTNLQPAGSISSSDPRMSGNNVNLSWNQSTIEGGTVPVDAYNIQVYPEGGNCSTPGAFCGTVNTNAYTYTIPSGIYRITFSVTPVNAYACGGGTINGATQLTTFQVSNTQISGYFFLDNEAVCGATQYNVNINPATGVGYDPNYICDGNLTSAQTAPASAYYTISDENNGYFLGNNTPRCNHYFRRNRSFQGGQPIRINGVSYQYGWTTDGRTESGNVNPPGTRYLQITNLQGATRFQASVGMEDEVRLNGCASNSPAPGMRFQVRCNNTATNLFDSGMMRINNPTQQVDLDITGCTSLQLVATPQAGAWYACNHGAWANPRITGYLKNGSVSPRSYQNAGAGSPPSVRVTDINSNIITATLKANNVGYSVFVPLWSPGGNNTVRFTAGRDAANNQLYCACGADPSDPTTCVRNGVNSPQEGVNFFFSNVNLNVPAWFQLWGGQLYSGAQSGEVIRSTIPASTCTSPSCSAALSARNSAQTVFSDGPVFTAGGTVTTGGYSTQRTPNSVMTNLPDTNFRQGYDYFYSRFSLGTNPTDDFSGQHGSGSSSNKPGGNGVFYSDGNLRIATNRWNLGAGEEIVVFVNGDLTLDDPGALGDLIRVQKGGAGNSGFLAFIVKGNIVITPSVGNTVVTSTAPNLEGIFIADGSITVQTSGAADKRFVGEGNFIGWGGVTLQRALSVTDNRNKPAELFIFRPEFIRDMPEEMKEPLYLWQEVNP